MKSYFVSESYVNLHNILMTEKILMDKGTRGKFLRGSSNFIFPPNHHTLKFLKVKCNPTNKSIVALHDMSSVKMIVCSQWLGWFGTVWVQRWYGASTEQVWRWYGGSMEWVWSRYGVSMVLVWSGYGVGTEQVLSGYVAGTEQVWCRYS